MLVIPKVMGTLAYQGLDDAGQLLGYSTGNCSPLKNNGPEVAALFVDFGETIELSGNTTG